jgi:hypothetical protein
VAASSGVAAREEVDSRYLEAVVVVAMVDIAVDTGYLVVVVVVASPHNLDNLVVVA